MFTFDEKIPCAVVHCRVPSRFSYFLNITSLIGKSKTQLSCVIHQTAFSCKYYVFMFCKYCSLMSINLLSKYFLWKISTLIQCTHECVYAKKKIPTSLKIIGNFESEIWLWRIEVAIEQPLNMSKYSYYPCDSNTKSGRFFVKSLNCACSNIYNVPFMP
jgi:hypothetical protein